MILMIRTDKPEAELYLYDNNHKVAESKWEAHRQLADTIHLKIKELLDTNDLNYKDLKGMAVFKGPGSFTGLRIGITVANTFAYSLGLPIVGAEGDKWREQAIKRLNENKNDKIIAPFYGAEANITLPKK